VRDRVENRLKTLRLSVSAAKKQDYLLNLKIWQFLALFNLALAVNK